MLRYWLLFGIAVTVPTRAAAQPERFELGQRLRSFERAWDRAGGIEAKKRAVGHLNQAVRSFFSFDFGGAGAALDRARHAVSSVEPVPAAVRWAESLQFRPESRLLDAAAPEVAVEVRPFYKAGGPLPENVRYRLRLGAGEKVEVPAGALPQTVRVPVRALPPGDDRLVFEVLIDGKTAAEQAMLLSRVADRTARLEKLRRFAGGLRDGDGIEQATVRHHLAILQDLAAGKVPETNIPAAGLLAEAEAVAEAIRGERRYYGRDRPGEFRLRVPVGSTYETLRLLVPGRTKGPVPILFALHGAGGSENLFFDGYGDGIAARLCKENGWILAATRARGVLGFGSPPDVAGLLEQLAGRYAIDAGKVYLVGHSMGAGHVLTIAQRTPEKFAGLAVLGGGGSVRRPEAFKNTACFVGCGKEDFARLGARRLGESLKKAGLPHLEVREYEHIEHLTIVREGLPDALAFWTTGRTP